MGLFRRKDKVVDLGKRYQKQAQRNSGAVSNVNNESSSSLGFLGSLASGSNFSNSQDSEYTNLSDNGGRKNKLAKRLLDMTNKIEDLSNQIYRMKQRVEVLEKKLKVGFE